MFIIKQGSSGGSLLPAPCCHVTFQNNLVLWPHAFMFTSLQCCMLWRIITWRTQLLCPFEVNSKDYSPRWRVFPSAKSRHSQRGPYTVGAMMWSCLWTLQTMTWSAPYARASSGVQLELHVTTSFARNASYSGWRGTGHNMDFVNWFKSKVSVLCWLCCCVCVLYRQETCPCCRKPVNPSLIFIMFKLSKSIGRMKIKVGNGNEERRMWFYCFSWVFLIRYSCRIS